MEEQLVHHDTTLLHYLPCALDVPLLQIFFHLHNIFTLHNKTECWIPAQILRN